MPRIDSTVRDRVRVESIRHSDVPVQTPLAGYYPLLGLFFLTGILVSSWIARVPAVRDALDITSRELGLLFPLGAIAAITTTAIGPRILARFGGAASLMTSAVLHIAGFGLLGFGPLWGNTGMFAAGILINGAAFALGSIVINVQSTALERRSGRIIVPRFHAAFSLGTVAGALLGAACAAWEVPINIHFAAVAILAAGWRWFSLDAVRDGKPRPQNQATRTRRSSSPSAWRESRMVLVGMIALSSTACEGAANDWLNLGVVDGFGASQTAGAMMFGLFVVAMTTTRLLGTTITMRWGAVTSVRASAVAIALGMTTFALAPSLPVAALGVVAWGSGVALVVPLAISAAAYDPHRAASRVAVVTGLATLTSLIVPPIVGYVAEQVGPRLAILVVTGAVIVILGLSGALNPHATRPAWFRQLRRIALSRFPSPQDGAQ